LTFLLYQQHAVDPFLLTDACSVVVLLSEQNALSDVSTHTLPDQVTASCPSLPG